jgi:phenylalanine-4-hydroxylase
MKVKNKGIKITETIPKHLLPYTTTQNTQLYTPIDHASWRYILKLSQDFFAERAHPIYLSGLKATGISSERIPSIEEMDTALRKFGWRAVSVSGFIPPAAFLEFLALGVLPIACEMRKVENINYTPAPDIVHEAAGHAPILADQEYAEYVKMYGVIASKAIYSQKDLQLFEAIRALSDIKEKPHAKASEIDVAQKNFEKAYASLDYVSEATQLARMSWWTIEYGMLGELNNPKIYGAGLLSSMGESFHCLDAQVKKIPLNYDCVHQAYDITRPQPQLYVSPSVKDMKKVLADYSKTMAYKKGGRYALGKAKHAQSLTTTVLDTGLQISGILKNFSASESDIIDFLEFEGSLQFSLKDNEIKDYRARSLPNLILSPMGIPVRVDGLKKVGSAWTQASFWKKNISKKIKAQFKSGWTIDASVEAVKIEKSKLLFVVLKDCRIWNPYEKRFVTLHKNFLLFGKKAVSVFGEAADRIRYMEYYQQKNAYTSNAHQINYDSSQYEKLFSAYTLVKEFRTKKKINIQQLEKVISVLNDYPKDWLLRWELLEVFQLLSYRTNYSSQISEELNKLKKLNKELAEVIQRGMDYLKKFSKEESNLMCSAESA